MGSSSALTESKGSIAIPPIPGLHINASDGAHRGVTWYRADVNRWVVSVGGAAPAAQVRARRVDPVHPSAVLDALGPRNAGELVQLSIELDLCGAWVTLANAGDCRPIAVRRAGWVDLRGHPGPPLGAGPAGYRDDRVGLGPGDALVLVPPERRRKTARAGAHHRDRSLTSVDDLLLDVLLDRPEPAASPSAHWVAERLPAAGRETAPVLVIAVPEDLGDDRHEQLASALGVSRTNLPLPGYPLGDLQPDLWAEPPAPPRTARLRLPARSHSVREVRTLLQRMVSSWRIAERVAADNVTLLASEVVTNALRHTATDATVILRYTGRAVEVSVRDGSFDHPTVQPLDLSRTGGRGMYLVDTLAAAWGSIATVEDKVVWFEIPVEEPVS